MGWLDGVVDWFRGGPSQPSVVLEAAKSARSRCATCRRPISDGELRLGVPAEAPRSEGRRTITRWHHLPCAARTAPRELEGALRVTTLEVPARAALETAIASAPAAEPAAPPPDAWWRAVTGDDIETVRRLCVRAALELRGREVDAEHYGHTALTYAAKTDALELARVLLDAGASTSAKCEKRTALHIAARRGHVGFVDALLTHGADPNAKGGFEDDAGSTPMHFAVTPEGRGGDARAVVRRLLEAGGKPDLRDARGASPLWHVAASESSLVAILLEAGASPTTPAKRPPWAPIHRAAFGGSVAIVELLLARGVDPSTPIIAEDSFVTRDATFIVPLGATPCDLADALGHSSAVRLLVARGGRRGAAPVVRRPTLR